MTKHMYHEKLTKTKCVHRLCPCPFPWTQTWNYDISVIIYLYAYIFFKSLTITFLIHKPKLVVHNAYFLCIFFIVVLFKEINKHQILEPLQ